MSWKRFFSLLLCILLLLTFMISVTFTAAAGATPPAVTTGAATGVGTTSATLNGNLTLLGTATSDNVSFEWGLTASYGNTTTPQTVTDTGPFSADISGLTPGITYHYRAKAVGDGEAYGEHLTFATGTTPPAVTTSAATAVGTTSATLNGNLTSKGTASNVSLSFQWGTTSGAYGSETTSQVKDTTGAFSSALSGLAPATAFYYRAKAVGDGDAVYGEEKSFTTNAISAPVVTTSAATNLAAASATLNGNLASLGSGASISVSFEWGLTASYGNVTTPEPKTATGTFTANLTSLTAKTIYHFRAIAVGDGTTLGDDVTFTTSTIEPLVTTNAASSVATTSATLNGNLASKGTADNVTVYFEWGLTTSYGSVTTAQAKTATGTFSDNLTDLTVKTTYHFRAIAVGDGTTFGNDVSFTTSTIPPSVTTGAATNLATTSATLNGDLIALGTASGVNVSFEWGVDTSYGNGTTPQAKTATGAFSDNLIGLTADTTYHFRAIAVGDGTTYGDDITFTTSPIEPLVTTDAATDLAPTSATLNGNLTSLGAADNVTVYFEWGLTISYGNVTTAEVEGAVGTFSANLMALTAKTTYHFRAIAVGAGTTPGDDLTFTTSVIEPLVTTGGASNVATTSATLNGNLTSKGTADNVTVYFEWGLTISYGNVTTAEVEGAIGTFSASLTGLIVKIPYHFRAIAVGDGSAVYGDDATFTTASQADTTAPVISAVNSSGITVSGATITWTTDETATTQVEYGLTTAYGSTETASSNAVKDHSVDLTDLEASKTYHYRVISKDAANNQAVSADATFTTTTATAATTGSGGGMPPWTWTFIVIAVGVGAGAAYFISTKLAKK